MAGRNDYSGIWYCCYWYPSNTHKGEDISEYYVQVHQKGNKLVLESLPNKINSYMMVNLTVDGDLATGNWEEQTSPTGAFAGSVYSGAMQLLIDEDGNAMHGQWVGVGQDDGVRKIYHGRWELTRAGHKLPEGKVVKPENALI